ncbi:MAG: amino acid permease [Bacteroidales bacterium]
MTETVLKRSLGLFPTTSIVVANMIGAGIFTTSGLILAQIHHPGWMMGLWVLGGVLALCGALSYGELGANIPKAGGEYQFLRDLYHPMLGFLSGWTSLIVGFSAPIAASAMGFSEYLFRALPAYGTWWTETAGLSSKTAGSLHSVAVIFLFAAIHYRGMKTGARVQNVLTLLKVALILGLIAAGLFSKSGDTSHFAGPAEGLREMTGWKSMGLSLMWIMFAYSGWNASTYIGGEIRNPEKTLPRSLWLGTGIVLVLYLGLNALFVYGIGPKQMEGVISIGGLAMEHLFGSRAGTLFSLLIAFALFSSLSAFLIIGPRVYYSMSRDGLFFRGVGRIHPRHQVPSNAIVLQAVLAVIMVVSGTFEQILTYMGFALGMFPLLTVLGVFRLRKRYPNGIRLRGFPAVQVLYALAGLLILGLSLMERPTESLIAIGTVLAGIPFYFHLSGSRWKVFSRRET